MPRPVSRRRLVVAAVLVVLAVVPNIVHVYDGIAYRLPRDDRTRASVDDNYPVVGICVFNRQLCRCEVSANDRARGIARQWEQYRGLWWLFAAVAGLVVVREFLPVPRLFGRDDQ